MKIEMTIEAAMIELNRCKVNGYMPTDWERRCRAIDTALAALDKQEPRKVAEKTDNLDHYIGKCPKCRTEVMSIENFCWHCGQALDWGGAE